MSPEKTPPPRLVVADDQEDLLAMMEDALTMHGFEIRTASNGKEALELIKKDPPDCVILDLFMPMMDGFAVCRELKADPLFQHLPIIILSATTDQGDKIQGLDSGADDFVTKPIDLAELVARIRMILRRTKQGLDANPLTRLPGNVSIQARISKDLASGNPLAVLYLDLNNFKAYNDAYGYGKGDEVIKATGKLVLETSRTLGNGKEFVGHIGGDDFILVTHPERMEELAKQIAARFDELAPSFYSAEDRARGKIVAKDRKGQQVEFPLLSIAIGVCHNNLKPLTSFAQVSQIGAELKKFAKAKEQIRSSYVLDRRKD
ncbi:MAG: response regulator [Elusimicrobiota bacterium]